jgi:hypothetical protein
LETATGERTIHRTLPSCQLEIRSDGILPTDTLIPFGDLAAFCLFKRAQLATGPIEAIIETRVNWSINESGTIPIILEENHLHYQLVSRFLGASIPLSVASSSEGYTFKCEYFWEDTKIGGIELPVIMKIVQG